MKATVLPRPLVTGPGNKNPWMCPHPSPSSIPSVFLISSGILLCTLVPHGPLELKRTLGYGWLIGAAKIPSQNLHPKRKACLLCHGKTTSKTQIPRIYVTFKHSSPEICPSGRGCRQLLRIAATSWETYLAWKGEFPIPKSRLFHRKPLRAVQRHTGHTDMHWKLKAAPRFTVGLETPHNLLL